MFPSPRRDASPFSAHVLTLPPYPLPPPPVRQLRKGTRAVAIWMDGQGYSCEVLGSAGRRQLAVQFEDGLQYDINCSDLRLLLDEPLYAARPPRSSFSHFHGKAWPLAAASPAGHSCGDCGGCGCPRVGAAHLIVQCMHASRAVKSSSQAPLPALKSQQ